jgi:hypothetical protein
MTKSEFRRNDEVRMAKHLHHSDTLWIAGFGFDSDFGFYHQVLDRLQRGIMQAHLALQRYVCFFTDRSLDRLAA